MKKEDDQPYRQPSMPEARAKEDNYISHKKYHYTYLPLVIMCAVSRVYQVKLSSSVPQHQPVGRREVQTHIESLSYLTTTRCLWYVKDCHRCLKASFLYNTTNIVGEIFMCVVLCRTCTTKTIIPLSNFSLSIVLRFRSLDGLSTPLIN